MELILPATMPVTLGALLAFLTLFASILGVYYRLSGQVQHLMNVVDKMAQRNVRADSETEAVKSEQAAQKTTIAVMAERQHHQGENIKRIDDGVQELLRISRSDK
jgi:hypothetical protein